MTRTPLARLILLALTLLFSFAAAGFELKREISRLQTEFGRSRPYPILIVDKEELNWRFAKANALGHHDDQAKEEKRIAIIRNYVKEEIGVELTDLEASQYDTLVTALKEGAFAQPILKSAYPAVYKMCAVFPASPDSNARLEYNRLLALDNKSVHKGQSFDDLKAFLPYEILARFSLYHELAHCLDQWYMPQTYDYEEPHTVHLSESFAETMALLMLQEEGHTDIAPLRAELRSVYAYRMGRFFAQNPQGGLGSPFYVAAGAIYNLADVLLAAQHSPLTTSLEQTAREIVEEHATPSRAFTAIVGWLQNPVETMARYTEWAQNSPDLFLAAWKKLVEFSDTIPLLAENAFASVGATAPIRGALPRWNVALLCSHYRMGQEAFESFVAQLRQDLRQGLGSPKEQTERQLELQNVHQQMQDRCGAH